MSKKDAKTANIHSADNLIVKMENEKLGRTLPETSAPIAKSEVPSLEGNTEEKEVQATQSQEQESDSVGSDVEREASEQTPESEQEGDKTQESEATSEDTSSADDQVDEYGNSLGKAKLYTEEEVQNMIRDRLKRGKHHEEASHSEVQQAAKDFTPNPESDDTWEQQLSEFIDKRIEQRETAARQVEWQEREKETQAEFETKFTQGMAKYKDFNQVVANKPITNAMMLAARSMKDPAAFIYAAAKQQPKELERISQIKDPVTQATEIGRLEERLKKARIVPQSPRPATKIKGDASSEMSRIDIDARIAAHAKSKIMR